ncbi:MAG: M14 family zinc carboxypeptidase [Gemmatimonadota bacterium]
MSPATRRCLTAVSAVVLATVQPAAAQTQAIDQEYTQKIKEYLRDPRISTELVDHLPASATVPTPLKFLGRIIGTPGELTYAKDIHRYFQALDQASDRVLTWNIGKTEEGRDMVALAVADAETIKQLEKYRGMLAALTDPRKTSEAEARRLIGIAKPIYYVTSGMHSPETGGPEMLMELAYRLAVEETPFVQTIRKGVITIITPVIEVDGREKQVDTYYFNKKRPADASRLPLMYWGKYVAHDNNRDGMGQYLALTRNVTQFFLRWTPTIMHDLHEAQTYLYASTGTGPYNEALDPITIDEWWLLAKTEVMEMTKRNVPGVWTYGFYDGWVPNYMFFIAHSHNAIGRFYEVQSYGPDTMTVKAGATTTSREWFRANPPLPSIAWGPRNNTNIQESALLIALNYVAKNRELFLENYWIKNKRAVDKGKNGPTYGWVIPAAQRRKADAADAVNELRRQGLEVHTANAAFTAGKLAVQAGDYVIRGDQPYRTLADMYFAIQNYAIGNPRPYDDTGWTFPLMRNVKVLTVTDKSALDQPMTLLTSEARASGGIEGSGPVVVVDHTTDNNLMAFRYKHADVRMQAAEEAFKLDGRDFRAGAFIIPNADRAKIEPTLKQLGLTGWAVASAPSVKTHDLDLPRIGYVHAWQNTQDEGWVRAAFDSYGVPYTYFSEQKLRDGGLRGKYDVIVFPHIGGSAMAQVNGLKKNDGPALPYRRTADTPNLGGIDESDDIRGGMGFEGLLELAKFVKEGGTLIVEGSTATIFPDFGLTPSVAVETPSQLFARGSVMRGVVSDRKSPIAYGFDAQVPVYFNQGPVLNGGGSGLPPELAAFFGGGGNPIPGVGQNTTPMANRLQISPWEPDTTEPAKKTSAASEEAEQIKSFIRMARSFGFQIDTAKARVVVQFPANPADILLSGTLAGGQALANKAQVIDAPLGKGHVVMFGIRPFWRWQTQGTFFLGFNAILNWNDLDAGKAPAADPPK